MLQTGEAHHRKVPVRDPWSAAFGISTPRRQGHVRTDPCVPACRAKAAATVGSRLDHPALTAPEDRADRTRSPPLKKSQIRQPVMMLTARAADEDRISGLSRGASSPRIAMGPSESPRHEPPRPRSCPLRGSFPSVFALHPRSPPRTPRRRATRRYAHAAPPSRQRHRRVSRRAREDPRSPSRPAARARQRQADRGRRRPPNLDGARP